MSNPKTDREMLQACLEAMEISRRGGGSTNWEYMIADLRKHLATEPGCSHPVDSICPTCHQRISALGKIYRMAARGVKEWPETFPIGKVKAIAEEALGAQLEAQKGPAPSENRRAEAT